MALVHSLNVSSGTKIAVKSGFTGIDKVPTSTRVLVRAPGPKGVGGSGVVGDVISDTKHHGGDDQAVYAYAREDLNWWESELGVSLRSGMFGENLTTVGLDVTGARIGERWRVGTDLVLQVTAPRIPCATFAVWMDQQGWLERFIGHAVPGAYLRVIHPGEVGVGDPIEMEFRPSHEVSIGLTFQAMTSRPELLSVLLSASEYLVDGLKERALANTSHEH
jgi:MOSC domain-containing protein YiiM